MENITCPRCGTVNPANAVNCKQCRINLKFALQNPSEVERLKKEEQERLEQQERLKQDEASAVLARSGWKCPKCGKAQPHPTSTNHCLHCNAPANASRLAGIDKYPAILEPPEITCYTIVSKQATVLAKPDFGAETLYTIGPGDFLPIVGEVGGFYQLDLPGGEKGFVQKASGKLLDVGTGEVKEPLGYARCVDSSFPADVICTQPDGTSEALYTLKTEDRLPIVGEREHTYKVQLPNGLRGWVNKGRVIRTISEDSLPVVQESSGIVSAIGSAVGIAALAGLAIVGSALAGYSEEARIRQGVDHALRDRGL